MGHLASHGVYSALRKRLDAYPVGAPESGEIYEILKVAFSEEEAFVASKMPLRFSTLERVSKTTGYEKERLLKILDGMTKKGLAIDVERNDGKTFYFLSPTVVGFFEFSMMRVRHDIDQKRLARLIHQYMFEDPAMAFMKNVGLDGGTSLFRTLANENSIAPEYSAEVLDYDSAVEVVKNASFHSAGLCHCRHVKEHLGERCGFPMDNCSSFGRGAEYIVRSGLGRRISKEESLDKLNEARSLGLVQIADNVKKRVSFICHCCGCCCGILEGFKRLKETACTMSSAYIAKTDGENCEGCAKCAKDCPVDAISLEKAEPTGRFPKRRKKPKVDEKFCLGCGVCQVRCETKAIRLVPREKRLIPPEDLYERLVMMALERGKLQNILFDDVESVTHRVLRGFVGAILKLPPTKRALAAKSVKSRFIETLAGGDRRSMRI